MSQPFVIVEHLSKCYRLDARRAHDRTLASSLLGAVKRPLRWATNQRKDTDTIWALRDVSFEVKPGEAVGIVGPNGAGKSTLLKIISRLTRPTSGRLAVQGRVASMLGLGVGFHPELTGRENVSLSGVILGLKRAEIRRRFDAIVDFSGIEAFIDVPVKKYSSGMRVRLAFAVMATLELEVLLIDDVLGVGDKDFRQKSSKRMTEMIDSGRTVLLVSHNQSEIERLCNWKIQMEKGRIVDVGATAKTTKG